MNPQPSTPLQTDLPFFVIHPEHEHVTWFLDQLKTHGWLTRRQLIDLAGLPHSERNQRWVRKLAEQAGDRVVKGQKGFNYYENCTLEEITHAANQSRAQARLMLRYHIGLKRRAHQRLENKKVER
jgi:hypothetical protein